MQEGRERAVVLWLEGCWSDIWPLQSRCWMLLTGTTLDGSLCYQRMNVTNAVNRCENSVGLCTLSISFWLSAVSMQRIWSLCKQENGFDYHLGSLCQRTTYFLQTAGAISTVVNVSVIFIFAWQLIYLKAWILLWQYEGMSHPTLPLNGYFADFTGWGVYA